MGGQFIIGTSGWSYNHWQGIFYPDQIKPSERLAYYASQFNSVEINCTFYRLPSEETFIKWRETVPHNFLFSIKASRYITHMKKLKNIEEAITNLMDKLKLLGKNLGPILFQFPPGWHYNGKRLNSFLSTFDPALKYTIEFRDSSWFNEEAYSILEKHGVALCLYHMPDFETPEIVTAPFVYIRFHGTKNLYVGSYSNNDLNHRVEAMKRLLYKGIDIYAYFNNDAAGNAINNARRLIELTG